MKCQIPASREEAHARLHRCAIRFTFALLVLSSFSIPCAGQGPPELSFPVSCDIGKSCVIQNYFDHDPRSSVVDYACGRLSYDRHDGTDIRLPNLEAMRRGVQVIAAADGKVRAVRDGMADVSFRNTDMASIKGKEAGNSVLIDHGNGWETQYSHLRYASVLVKAGDEIMRGQPLGLIGMSGYTEFPHLHFTVRNNGIAIDPFAGPGSHPQCGLALKPIWNEKTLVAMSYSSSGVLGSGFAGEAVTLERVKDGRIAIAHATAPVLAFWIFIYGAMAGDEEHLVIYGPNGEIFSERRSIISGNKAEWYAFVGKKLSEKLWPAGVYRGEYTLTRGASGRRQKVVTATRDLEITR